MAIDDNSAAARNPSLLDEQRHLARARILRAAQRALADRGLAASVDDVAEQAEVSRRTVFRHFATRERLFAAAIREGLAAYSRHVPRLTPDDQASDSTKWLLELLTTAHRINATNGRAFWDLSVLDPELPGELAEVGLERREARQRFVTEVTRTLWRARGGQGRPPEWLADAVAVHLSGFTTQSLAGDFGRTPEQVAEVSARVLEAAVDAALAERKPS